MHVYGACQGDVSPVMWVGNCGSSAANMGVCRGVFSAGVGRILFLFARMKMYTTLQTLSEVFIHVYGAFQGDVSPVMWVGYLRRVITIDQSK
jgi:hypothetical protein